MIWTALIVIIAMAGAFYAGTQWPLKPRDQNLAWEEEGYAAAATGIPLQECPYREIAGANFTAFTFWRYGYRKRLDAGL